MTDKGLGLKANFLAALMLLLAPTGTLAQTTSPAPRLTGIVNLGDAKMAVLETAPDGPFKRGGSFILSEGQSEGRLEVLRILPETRTVRVKFLPNGGSSTLTLTNNTHDAQATNSGVIFENASLESVLELYSEFSRRTLLRSPKLQSLFVSLVAIAKNHTAAALAIQRALNEKGMATIPDGEKFMMIVPREQAASVKPRSSEIKPSDGGDSKMFPPGTINFPDPGIPVAQLLQIYAAFCGRQYDQSVPMPPTVAPTIRFCTQTPLNRAEIFYAFDTLLDWDGLKMVPVGKNQIKAVPIQANSH